MMKIPRETACAVVGFAAAVAAAFLVGRYQGEAIRVAGIGAPPRPTLMSEPSSGYDPFMGKVKGWAR